MTDAIQAGIGSGQGTVGGTGLEPVLLVVIAPLPIDAVLLGDFLIRLADAQTLHAAHLLDGFVLEGCAGKPFLIHAIDDGKPLGLVGIEAGLAQQTSRAKRSAGAMGVETDALLANPGEQAIVSGKRLDGGVGDGAARTEQNEAELVDGNRGIACEVMKNQPSGFLIESPMFEIEVRPTVAEAWKFVQGSHGLSLGSGQGEQTEAESLGGANTFRDGLPHLIGIGHFQNAVEADSEESALRMSILAAVNPPFRDEIDTKVWHFPAVLSLDPFAGDTEASLFCFLQEPSDLLFLAEQGESAAVFGFSFLSAGAGQPFGL